MHGSGGLTNPLTALFGGRVHADFYNPGAYCPDETRFLTFPARVPEVWRHLRLLDFLGVLHQGEELEFPLSPEDRRSLAALGERPRPGEYVCIHPGDRAAARRWPPERFAVVADTLARLGFRVALTGSRDEQPLTRAVAAAMTSPALDLAGCTDLGALGVLLCESRLLVCNDTGVSHLAAALRVPSVVVFHHLSEMEGWPPRDRLRHRVVTGVSGASLEQVIAEAKDLLQQDRFPGTEVPRRPEALSNGYHEVAPPCAPCAS
jgi:ADP-heptose:LPS heptosyltransferase